ncbi:hypothetical protein AB3N60_10375 [Leptospira sp. WS39.C2]
MKTLRKFLFPYVCLLFGFPFDPIESIGLDVGIFGHELFLKENQNKKQLEVPGWDFHSQKWGRVFVGEPYLNRVSGESLFVGIKDKNQRDKIHWNLDIQLTSGPDTGLRNYYLGKNHFFGYQTKQFFLGLGRREHLFSPKSFSSYFDGGDGLFLEIKPETYLTFQFFLWDFYSGSLLLTKDQFRSILRLEDETDLLKTKGNQSNLSRNHHRRQSFGLVIGQFLQFRLGFHYLELGSFGPNTKDHPQETKKNSADGDSLFSGNLGIGFHTQHLSFEFDFLWCKGSDRTRSQIAKNPGTLPIAGEAIQFGTELRFGGVKIRSSHFLSDRDEKNEKHQIVKEGYVFFGSHPSQTPYISQIFRVFPSAAVTELGYEKNYAIIEGRTFGYLSEFVLSYQYQLVVVKLIGNYFLPYKQNGSFDGKINFQKSEFEKFFIAEVMLEVAIKDESGFELGIGTSKLFLPESLGIVSNFGYLYGRCQI